MDIPFKLTRLEDKETMTSFTFPSDYRSCDFPFVNMRNWCFLYDSGFAIADDYLLVRSMIGGKNRFTYMMPVGSGDLVGTVRLLKEDSLKYEHPFCMLDITPDAKEQLEGALPGSFFYISERDHFDYIYLQEDLTILRGKKYQPKRNHTDNFKKQYSYEYVSIMPDIVPQYLKLERKWYKADNEDNDEEELSDECRFLAYALHHFDSLSLIGSALRVNNEIIALSSGAPIDRSTFGVHVEKADVNLDGAYIVANQEFASHPPEQYTYMNREEDLGTPGLRQARLFHQSTILLEKSAVMEKQLMRTE